MIQAGNARMVQSWLRAGNDPDVELVGGPFGWTTPLGFAASYGNLQICRMLIRNGAHLNFVGDNQQMTALMCACAEKQVDAVKFLVGSGADIDLQAQSGWTALMFAAQVAPMGEYVEQGSTAPGSDSINREQLIQKRSTSTERGKEIVNFLLQKGANPNLTNSAGQTVFDLANVPIGNPANK